MSQIKQVKEATDIIEIIGSRIELKRSGVNYKAHCPFHSEKSPSFFVNELLQRYRCFGCGEQGDVFTFLEKYEGMTFYESLTFLADQAGIKLEQHTRSADDAQRETLKEILDLSRQYFHYLLTEHAVGESARAYLKQRGITNDSIRQFQLGFSQPKWEGLITFLHKKKKYNLALIEKAGLIIKGGRSGYYDRFRGRLMFPLKNHRGQVVGFSGRLMDNNAKEAKYINTPETQLYHKSQLLFGLSENYTAIREQKKIVVVEGEFDVISSVQAHVNNVAALKGSALTQDHAKLLGRTVEQVLLALDTDEAGVTATKRAIQVLESTELELRVVQLPSGKDPDDLAKSDPKTWRTAVKQSISAYEFLINVAVTQHDPATPDGRRYIIKELGPILAGLQHAVELEYYINTLAEKLNVNPQIVKGDIEQYRKQAGLGARRTVHSTNTKRATHSNNTQQSESSERPVSDRRQKLEEYILFLLFQGNWEDVPKRASQLIDSQIEFVVPGATQLVTATATTAAKHLKQFAQTLADDLQQLLFEVYSHSEYMQTSEGLDVSAEWKTTLKNLKKEVNTQKIKEIGKKIAEYDKKKNKTAEEIADQEKLLKEIVQLQAKQ